MGDTFSGYSNAEVRDFFNPMGNQQATDLAAAQMAEGNKRYRKNMAQLRALIPQYQQRSDQANKSIESLFSNAPDLDLSQQSAYLSGVSSRTAKSVSDQMFNAGQYLSKGTDYISSLLSETKAGTEGYLTESKRLANQNLPGLDIYKDQAGTSMASNLQAMRSMGVSSPSAISNVMQGNQQNALNIALEAGKYKTQARQNLSNAYLTSGQANASAYGSAAGFMQGQAGLSQSQAGIAQNLGQFQAGVIGEQAGYKAKEYAADQSNWQNNLNWRQSQAQMYDPLSFQANLYGNAAGIGWSQYQGGVNASSNALNATQQNTINAASTAAKIFAK